MDFFYRILFLIVLFVSNVIQAITGFAGTVLAMPPSIKLIGVNDAKVILNIMALISCFIIAVKNIKYINKKELRKIVIFMSVGMIIGIEVLKIFPTNILLKVYGMIIILIAVKNLCLKKDIKFPKVAMIFILIISGIIHGMFVSGGALLVVYAASVLKDKDEFRATISPVWVILNSFLLITQISNNMITSENIILSLICIIPLFLAIWLGNKIQKKIDQKSFLKIVYILLIISGLLVII